MEEDGNKSNPFSRNNYFHGESSDTNNLNLNLEIGSTNFQQLQVAGEDWLNPFTDQAWIGQQLEQRNFEPNVDLCQAQGNMSLEFSHFANGPTTFEGASHGVLSSGLNLNAPLIGDSSNVVAPNWGAPGHVLEDINNQDPLAESRHPSLKRRAEEAFGFHLGESSNPGQQSENSRQQARRNFQQLVAASSSQTTFELVGPLGSFGLDTKLATQLVTHDLNLFQNLQGTRLGIMQQEQDSISHTRNMMNAPQFVIPEFESGEPIVHMQGNLAFHRSRNLALAPRNGHGSSMFAPSSSRFPPPHPLTMGDIINHTQSYWHPNFGLHHGPYATSHEMGVSIGGGNANLSQAPLRLSPMMRAERQDRGLQIFQSPNATNDQHRLSSEDFMAFNALMPNGLSNDEEEIEEEPEDEYEDMRLDVDNMSYEELLALEEQIGDVPIGIPENVILARLRRRIYQPVVIGPGEPEPCHVCQEDYIVGDELGKLDCGHDYHFNCIKQWIAQKNSCPICKKTALDI